MSEGTSPVTIPEGTTPAPPAVETGIPAAAPEVSTGQAESPQSPGTGQATSAPQVAEEPTFFDPSALAPELMPGYKQMQAAFTKKMQALSTDRQKVEAYNRFETDREFQTQVLQQLASQHGYSLTRAQAQAIQDQQPQQTQQWEPQSWDEVMARAEERAEQRIMEKLQPFIGTVQQQKARIIERDLETIDPQWRTYEDTMREKLQRHPTLVNDVAELYRLSVPEEVLTSRAVQTALAKFQSKAEQAKVSGPTKTSRTEPAAPDLSKMKSGDAFNAAVEMARKQIASGG
jgi:hypothetical protein